MGDPHLKRCKKDLRHRPGVVEVVENLLPGEALCERIAWMQSLSSWLINPSFKYQRVQPLQVTDGMKGGIVQ